MAEPSLHQWSRPLVPKADGRTDASFSSQIPHGRRLRESRREAAGAGPVPQPGRMERVGGAESGCQGQGPRASNSPPPQSTEKALKKKKKTGKKKKSKKAKQRMDEGKPTTLGWFDSSFDFFFCSVCPLFSVSLFSLSSPLLSSLLPLSSLFSRLTQSHSFCVSPQTKVLL